MAMELLWIYSPQLPLPTKQMIFLETQICLITIIILCRKTLTPTPTTICPNLLICYNSVYVTRQPFMTKINSKSSSNKRLQILRKRHPNKVERLIMEI